MTTPMTIDPTILLLLIGCLFILMFGGLSFVRREGLSAQFALESVLAIGVLAGGSRLVGISLSPFLYVVLLYLITMRGRLVVDLASLLAQRDRYRSAFRLYRLALSLWPDLPTRLVALVNRGTAEVRSGQTQTSISTLETALAPETQHHLGLKYECAARYNLGVAYERIGEISKATAQFREVVEMFPGSQFGRAAANALKGRSRKTMPANSGSEEDPDMRP